MTQAAPAVAFYCVFSHHDHAMDHRRDWRPFGTCGCCESWVIPAPSAVAVACFGPRGVEDVCRQCLDDYLGRCSNKDREVTLIGPRQHPTPTTWQ